jgi:hypothetical protein
MVGGPEAPTSPCMADASRNGSPSVVLAAVPEGGARLSSTQSEAIGSKGCSAWRKERCASWPSDPA